MTDLKRTRKIFVAIFALCLLAMIWPVYPFFNQIRPLVLGMPFSLFFLVAVLLCCFLTLTLLYFWEKSKGELD